MRNPRTGLLDLKAAATVATAATTAAAATNAPAAPAAPATAHTGLREAPISNVTGMFESSSAPSQAQNGGAIDGTRGGLGLGAADLGMQNRLEPGTFLAPDAVGSLPENFARARRNGEILDANGWELASIDHQQPSPELAVLENLRPPEAVRRRGHSKRHKSSTHGGRHRSPGADQFMWSTSPAPW